MRYALAALCFAAAVALSCRKAPMYDEKKQQSEAAPAAPSPAAAPQKIDASPLNGAALIQKAQGAADKANAVVGQEQKTDVPQQ